MCVQISSCQKLGVQNVLFIALAIDINLIDTTRPRRQGSCFHFVQRKPVLNKEHERIGYACQELASFSACSCQYGVWLVGWLVGWRGQKFMQ
jgi:hypothetical protein